MERYEKLFNGVYSKPALFIGRAEFHGMFNMSVLPEYDEFISAG